MVTLQKKIDVNGNQFTFKWKKKINRLVRKYYVDLITCRRNWLFALCEMRKINVIPAAYHFSYAQSVRT